MRSTLRRSLRQYAALFAVWTALGLFMFSQSVTQRFFSKDPTPLWHYLASWMAGVHVWFLLTPVMLWLCRRFPFDSL
jgi:O-antigen/teichoic acid export membrane protein